MQESKISISNYTGGFFMSFKGFDVPSGHTQIPNEFIEMVLQSGVRFDPRNPEKPILSIGEIKIMLFMFRETVGWQRQGNSLEFTFKDLVVATFLGKATVNDSLKSLIAKDFIQRAEIEGKMRYRLNLKDYQDYPWELSREWKKTFKIEEKKQHRFVNRTKDGSDSEPESVRIANQSQFVNRTRKIDESFDNPVVKPPLKKVLNKVLKKDLKKNTYLSNVDSLNVTSNVKNILAKMVDRLVLDSIDIFDLENNFNANVPDKLNEYQYAEVLLYVLENTSDKIKSIQKLMNVSIKNYLDFKQQQSNENNTNSHSKKSKRKEVLPDWFDKEEGSPEQTSEDHSALEERKRRIEEKKRLLEEKLSKYKD